MVMRLPTGQAPESVEAPDEFLDFFREGRAHAAKFYASGRNTLVDQLSQDEWEQWDGADEKALVSDPDGIDLQDDVELAA
ncbi:hypothetical protein [Microvirga massiliensis]|uniref:hypothetical protein n=1 Tax=Microvirga massiliensis TaxID=1033741 RepID=UPI00062BC2D4|nr:hypothetical protein [Microvirga massiliensis]